LPTFTQATVERQQNSDTLNQKLSQIASSPTIFVNQRLKNWLSNIHSKVQTEREAVAQPS